MVRCLGQVLDSLSFWVSPELELPAFGGNQLLDKISLIDYPLSVSVPFKWTNWAREKDTHIQSSKYLDSSWDGENELEQELGQKTSSCLKVSLLDSKTGRECRWQTEQVHCRIRKSTVLMMLEGCMSEWWQLTTQMAFGGFGFPSQEPGLLSSWKSRKLNMLCLTHEFHFTSFCCADLYVLNRVQVNWIKM